MLILKQIYNIFRKNPTLYTIMSEYFEQCDSVNQVKNRASVRLYSFCCNSLKMSVFSLHDLRTKF